VGSLVYTVSGIAPQLSRYAVASAVALTLDFTVYLILTDSAVSAPLAGVIGYGLGMTLHFLLSTRFVFDASATGKEQARLFAEFALSGVAGAGITALVIALAIGLAGLAALPAKALAAGASFLVVFALRRSLVFAKRGTVMAIDRLMSAQQSSAERMLAELTRTAPTMQAVWALILLLAAGLPVLARIAGVTIAWEQFWTLPALAIALGALGILLRAHGRWPRLADVAEVAGALGLLAVLVPLLTCILARSGAPLADQRLIAWDAALGFDWLYLVSQLREHRILSLVLSHAYASLMQQPTLLVLALGLLGSTSRLKQFALAWAFGLVTTALIFPWLPALGGYLHYGFAPADFPFIRVHAAWQHSSVLVPLRDGTMTVLGRLALEGIVTFPSFHTCAAVLLAWGFWGVRGVRWPALGLNATMIASCPFVGGHYVVDVIAGAVLACVAIKITDPLGATAKRAVAAKGRSAR
jgi:putative flippase GtrA